MSSVLGNGYGFNSGNQVRNELRTLQNRIDQLASTLTSLKAFLVSVQPEKKEEIEAIFNNTDSTSAPAPPPAPPTPPPRNVVNAALNRVRA